MRQSTHCLTWSLTGHLDFDRNQLNIAVVCSEVLELLDLYGISIADFSALLTSFILEALTRNRVGTIFSCGLINLVVVELRVNYCAFACTKHAVALGRGTGS
jgi:hypothetical protein